MKDLIKKHLDFILYGIFGVLTTIVNIGSYWVFADKMHIDVMISTVLAWILAVLIAYLTNRKWVFHSTAKGMHEIVKEIISFFSCRIATGIVDWLCMFIFVEKIGMDDMLIKTLANILVIILNYVASKLVIFKHDEEKQ